MTEIIVLLVLVVFCVAMIVTTEIMITKRDWGSANTFLTISGVCVIVAAGALLRLIYIVGRS